MVAAALILGLYGATLVALDTSPCATALLDREELRRQLALELMPAEVTTSSAAPAEVRLSVQAERCEPGTTRFLLEVEVRATRLLLRGPVDLEDVPAAARPRTLAVALAELWSTLMQRPLPRPPLRVSAPPAPSPPAAPAPTARWLRAAIFAGARAVPRYGTASFGGRGAVYALGERFGLSADLGLDLAEASDPLGRAQLGLLGGGIAAYLRADLGTIEIALGPRVELDYAWVTGTARDAGAISARGGAFTALAGVRAELGVALGGEVTGLLGVDLAGVLRGIEGRADDRNVIGLSGLVLGLSLGAALGL